MRFPMLISTVCLLTVSVPVTFGADSFETVTVFQNGQDGYPVFRIPALIRAENGDLLAFCEARQGGDASTIDLVMKRSTDGGNSWSELQIVQDHHDFKEFFPADSPPITVGNPAPVVDLMDRQHHGRIWLPFTLENDRVFVTYSDAVSYTHLTLPTNREV